MFKHLFVVPMFLGLLVVSAQSDTLENRIEATRVKFNVPGLSVIVVQNGKLEFSKGFGMADRERNIPMTSKSSLMLGSTNKSITALAILSLVKQGKLDLNAPISQYLEFNPTDARAKNITAQQLLTHTAGIDGNVNLTDANRDATALERYAKAVLQRPLVNAPGATFSYASDGYTVLGWLLEQRSGQAFATYLEQHVLLPLGMTNSSFDFAKAPKLEMAQMYFQGMFPIFLPFSALQSYVPQTFAVGLGGAPAAYMISNAEDVAKYLKAMLEPENHPSLEILATQQTQTPTPSGERYGYGWISSQRFGLPVLYHVGDVGVSGSVFVLVPSKKLAIGILTNTAASAIAEPLTRLLLEGK